LRERHLPVSAMLQLALRLYYRKYKQTGEEAMDPKSSSDNTWVT